MPVEMSWTSMLRVCVPTVSKFVSSRSARECVDLETRYVETVLEENPPLCVPPVRFRLGSCGRGG